MFYVKVDLSTTYKMPFVAPMYFLYEGGPKTPSRPESILSEPAQKRLKEPSKTLFRGVVALLVPELCASLTKNVELGQIYK